MKLQNLFKEFMMLSGYTFKYKELGETDVGLYNYTILRFSGGYAIVISLTTGLSIKIPSSWFDIFSSLNTWGGHRILEYKEKPENKIDLIIYYGFYLIYYYNLRKPKEFIKVLSEICKIKTSEFRDWFNREFNETIMPIELNTIDKYEEL